MGEAADHLRCSFCGKHADEVTFLLAGPSAFICEDRVGAGMETIADAREKRKLELAAEARGLAIISKADAERLAWMRTWTVAGGERHG